MVVVVVNIEKPYPPVSLFCELRRKKNQPEFTSTEAKREKKALKKVEKEEKIL